MLRRLALACLVAPLVCLAGDGDDDDLAKELPRLKPTEPAQALSTFQIHEGFSVAPIAVEPEVTDPVSACFDADGRLYVVEMRGYPYPQDVPSGRVRRLEDRDGDGSYEHAVTFLDGLSWPTSVVPYDGGVFVAVAPDILYARDDDGDGKADQKKVMFSGFGHENVQALLNGLHWGPDGWIYGVAAGNGGEIKNLSRPDDKPVLVRGRDFRFKPNGSAFEAISGGGQFGHSFDDWGHRFVCNNSNHIRQIVLPSRYLERNRHLAAPAPLIDIAVEGGAAPVFRISPPEPWRVVRTRQRAADPAFRKKAAPSELHASGFFTSATGVTIYRGSAYPPEYRGNAFVGDVGGNLVHRKVLEPDGPIFKATRADKGREFLASTDNWFRPVNLANSPDGTLLVLDMYRETIEHPWSIPEPIKKHLDLTSGHDRGRIYEIRPKGFQRRADRPAYSKADSLDLVKVLSDPDAWRRETAQRLLIERGKPSSEVEKALHDLARDTDQPALGRVHALWTLDVLGELTPEDIGSNAQDDVPGLREQSARLWETFLKDDPENIGPLADLASDPDAMVRLQAAFSLGDARGAKALDALAEIARRDGANRWTRVAVLSGLAGRAGEFAEILAQEQVFGKKESGPLLLGLAELVGAENQPEEVASFVKRFAASGSGSKAARPHDVLTAVGRGLSRSGGSLRTLLNGPLRDDLEPIFAQAAKTVEGTGPVAARVEAAKLTGLGPEQSALAVLPDLLSPREPVALQLAALQALAPIKSPEVGVAIVGHWRSLGPSVRREAAEVMLARADRAQALLDALEGGIIARGDLDPARLTQLQNYPKAEVKTRASKLLGQTARADRAPVVARYQAALNGDISAERGRAVFRKTCSTCHKAEGQGQDVGPDLATVTGRSPEDLVLHILDPNREVLPNYLSYNIETSDGRILSGIIASESADALTLKRAEGASDVVPRDHIEAIASSGLSLMPEGLENDIDPQSMADLVAYLLSLQAKAPPAR